MATTDNLNEFLTNIADTIRETDGSEDLINPQDFSDKIRAIGGKSIASIRAEYAHSSSDVEPANTVWTTTRPTAAEIGAGNYLWTRIVFILLNDDEIIGPAFYTKQGIDGAPGTPGTNGTNGAPGPAGKGISDIEVAYCQSASNYTNETNLASLTWSQTLPSTLNAGEYLYVRTTYKYTDNTEKVVYQKTRNGSNGAKGDTGPGATFSVSGTTLTITTTN